MSIRPRPEDGPNSLMVRLVWIVCFSVALVACQKDSEQAKKILEKAVADSKSLIQNDKFDFAKAVLDKAKTELDQTVQLPPVFEEITKEFISISTWA